MRDWVADLSVSLTSGQLTLRSIFVSSEADSSSIVWEKLYNGPCNRVPTYQQAISLGKNFVLWRPKIIFSEKSLMHGPALVPNELILFCAEFSAPWGCAVVWLILTPSEVVLLNDSYNPLPHWGLLLNNTSCLTHLRLCCWMTHTYPSPSLRLGRWMTYIYLSEVVLLNDLYLFPPPFLEVMVLNGSYLLPVGLRCWMTYTYSLWGCGVEWLILTPCGVVLLNNLYLPPVRLQCCHCMGGEERALSGFLSCL